MALTGPPPSDEDLAYIDGLIIELLYNVSKASGISEDTLAAPLVRQRLIEVGRELRALGPLAVHVVSMARLHLPELVNAMRADPRAQHVLEQAPSTKQSRQGLDPSRN